MTSTVEMIGDMQVWRFGRLDGVTQQGAWTGEPDKAHWVDKATDLDCLIVRGRSGALCGYVAVPPGHKYHGLDYDAVPSMDVHGGLTFASSCDEESPSGICHVPSPGRPGDVWWLGFGCAHAWDVMPILADTMEPIYAEIRAKFGAELMIDAGIPSTTYKDVAYVRQQCELLAAQLAA